MSYTIEDSKFVIFGNGYDGTRNNSGEGSSIVRDTLNIGAYFGAFDITGQYCWIYTVTPSKRLIKYKTSDWTEVSHSISIGQNDNVFVHPVNTDNNIGILISNENNQTTTTIFDLTDGTVTLQANSGYYISGSQLYECVIIGTTAYLMRRGERAVIYALNCETGSLSQHSQQSSGMASQGFIDNDMVFIHRMISWYGDYKGLGGASFSFSNQWWVNASVSGSSGFPYIAFNQYVGGNGYVYIPTYKNGKWGLGKYSGDSASDYETPNPIKVFGDTTNALEFDHFGAVYSNEKSRALICATSGMYITNFDNLTYLAPITDAQSYNVARPLCINNHFALISAPAYQYTRIYRFR